MYMYNKNLLKIYITLVISITTTAASLANVTGIPSFQNWPQLDVPPPAVAAWTALVDKSKYPQAPKNPVGYACQQGADTYCSF
ncbi:791_t:CDS:1, partial [Dentiscutata heterogama]